MECAGDGSCFEQVGINSYERTDYKCENKCALQKCPNFARCGRLHPAWYLGCNGGFCLHCNRLLFQAQYGGGGDDDSSAEGSVSSSTDDDADAESDAAAERRLLARLLPTQPLTHEEAVQQFHALQLRLAPHLVTELPAEVRRGALAEMWGVTLGDAVQHHVHGETAWGCCRRRKSGKKEQ